MIGKHLDATRVKIGAGVDKSAWRRKTKDKKNDMQSTAGHGDADYSSPSRSRSASPMLWEETHNSLVWE